MEHDYIGSGSTVWIRPPTVTEYALKLWVMIIYILPRLLIRLLELCFYEPAQHRDRCIYVLTCCPPASCRAPITTRRGLYILLYIYFRKGDNQNQYPSSLCLLGIEKVTMGRHGASLLLLACLCSEASAFFLPSPTSCLSKCAAPRRASPAHISWPHHAPRRVVVTHSTADKASGSVLVPLNSVVVLVDNIQYCFARVSVVCEMAWSVVDRAASCACLSRLELPSVELLGHSEKLGA